MKTIPSKRIITKSSIANLVHLLLVFLLINSLANHATAVIVDNTLMAFKPAIRTMANGFYSGDSHLRAATGRSCEVSSRCGKETDGNS
ncbi:hypothetical protein BVRB_4g089390 [Beta vulgaris subsp. vulgaris]|nr:hypothetical protein BVRB_4g089390 [Beta vulgaris subsp. vulgaris]